MGMSKYVFLKAYMLQVNKCISKLPRTREIPTVPPFSVPVSDLSILCNTLSGQ